MPGDPDQVAYAGRYYASIADSIRTAAAKLRALADDPALQSQAVDAVRAKATEVADDITRAQLRYDTAGRELTRYATELEHAQADSYRLLVQARQLMDQHRSALAILDMASGTGDSSPECLRARCSLEEAEAALVGVRKRLKEVETQRDAAAERARHAIDDAKHQTKGLNDGWWENWGAKVVKTVAQACDYLAAGAAALSLLMMAVPVIGAPVAGVLQAMGLALAVVSTAANLIVAVAGDGSTSKNKLWQEVGWSALGLATFGVGRAGLTALRTSVRGAHGAAREVAGRFAAQAPAVSGALGLPTTSNSAKAIDKMIGRNPISKSLARDFVRASDGQGLRPAWKDVARDVRQIPDEAFDDLQKIRNASLPSLSAAWAPHIQQIGHEVGTRQLQALALRLLGEHLPAEELSRLHALPRAIKESEAMARHLTRVNVHTLVFGAASMAETALAGRDVLH